MVNTRRSPTGTLLLATDLRAESSAAFDQAVRLAAALDWRLLIVHVLDARRAVGPRVDQLRSQAERAMLGLVVQARQRAVAVDFLIWQGDTGPDIVAIAQAEQARLITIGRRVRSSPERALTRSISDYVVRHSNTPVLVVSDQLDQSKR